jgi:hypothetical protein
MILVVQELRLTETAVSRTATFNFHFAANIWPFFQYVSMGTSLDQQYENSYYISCRKYSQDWRYCQQGDISFRWLFFGFF